jgi:hypothetical protein
LTVMGNEANGYTGVMMAFSCCRASRVYLTVHNFIDKGSIRL